MGLSRSPALATGLAALAALFLAAPQCRAAQVPPGSPSALEVSVGFDGHVVPAEYAPIFLRILPPPEPDTLLSVTMRSLVRRPGRGYSRADAHVPLSTTVFHISHPAADRPLVLPVVIPREARILQVEVDLGPGRTVYRAVSIPDAPGPVTLVLTRRREALGFLSAALGSVVYPSPAELPGDWRCYHSVSHVILDNLALAELPADVQEALGRAVTWGAGLFVTGPGLATNRGSRLLGPLAGVTPIGWTPPIAPAALQRWLAPAARGAGALEPLVALKTEQGADFTLVAEDGLPLVIRAQVLNSAIVACTFDPAALAWSRPEAAYRARAAAWEQLLRFAEPGWVADLDPQPFVDSLVPERARISSALWPVCALLALFAIVLGPVNYLIVRRARRREWLLLTVPAAVFLFLAAAALIFRATLPRRDLLYTQTAVATIAGLPQGVELTYFGVFPRGQGPQAFGAPAGSALHTPAEESPFPSMLSSTALEARPPWIEETEGGAISIANIWQRPRAMRFLASARVVDLRPAAASARLEGDALVGSVTNTFGEPLDEVMVGVRWRSIALGRLLPGETAAFRLQLGPPERFDDEHGLPISCGPFSHWLQGNATSRPRGQGAFLRELFDTSPDLFAHPVVIGWGARESPIRRPGADREERRVYLLAVPISPPRARRFAVPAGVAASRVQNLGIYLAPGQPPTAEAQVFTLPIGPAPLAECSLTLHAYASAPRWAHHAPGPDLRLFDWREGRWETLREDIVGHTEVAVADALRFVKQPEGWVAVGYDMPSDDEWPWSGPEPAWRARFTYLDLSFEGSRP